MFRRLISRTRVPALACSILVGGTMLAAPTYSAAQSFDAEETAEIGNIVRNYILENPEIILEAVQILQQREEESQAVAARENLSQLSDQIFNSPSSPVMGEADGDVVLVEFFDYQCGYCERVLDDVFALSEEDDNLRVVFKELPILGPMSVVASRAALAARNQDLYVPYHNALMAHEGRLSEEAIFQIARELGLDVDQLAEDMASPEVIGEIEANLALAQSWASTARPLSSSVTRSFPVRSAWRSCVIWWRRPGLPDEHGMHAAVSIQTRLTAAADLHMNRRMFETATPLFAGAMPARRRRRPEMARPDCA